MRGEIVERKRRVGSGKIGERVGRVGEEGN